MGICFGAYSLGRRNLELVLSDPALVWRVLDDEDDYNYLAQLAAESKPSLLQRLFGKAPPVRSPRQLTFDPQERQDLDMDKSWDGVRACIRRCAPQAPDFFEGDGKVGDFEVGYGPAIHVQPETVRSFAQAIEGLDESALLQAFRTLDFKGVYLEELWTRQDDQTREYLLENFLGLQAFVQHCAAHDQGAILQFS